MVVAPTASKKYCWQSNSTSSTEKRAKEVMLSNYLALKSNELTVSQQEWGRDEPTDERTHGCHACLVASKLYLFFMGIFVVCQWWKTEASLTRTPALMIVDDNVQHQSHTTYTLSHTHTHTWSPFGKNGKCHDGVDNEQNDIMNIRWLCCIHRHYGGVRTKHAQVWMCGGLVQMKI